MAEIINLNKFRKSKERAARAKAAPTNRVRFGRTKEERAKAADEAQKADQSLDDKKLD
jgi:hypothetical protein